MLGLLMENPFSLSPLQCALTELGQKTVLIDSGRNSFVQHNISSEVFPPCAQTLEFPRGPYRALLCR